MIASGLICALVMRSASAADDGSDAIPVVVEKVRRQDVPLYIDGLCKAQALNTVTVRAQVGGQITRVAFEERQFVHAGDALIEPDPRLYQTAYDEALARET